MGRRATFTQAELAAAAKVAVAGGVSITLEDADGRRAIVSPVAQQQETPHPASPDDALAGWLKGNGDRFEGSA